MPRSSLPAPDPYANLYGTIDPSDGIEYRQAGPVEIERGGQGPLPPFSVRYIIRKRNRFRVRVKIKGELRNVGSFGDIRKAQKARNKYLEKVYGKHWRERLR